MVQLKPHHVSNRVETKLQTQTKELNTQKNDAHLDKGVDAVH